ncbi:hypothetical protein ACFY5F_05195 [Streptomyces sp. NPDC013161]|uniref:hypothetical protein n=1 Tax=Streptomyces sp. NPDC013161 TaxID=3364862 RepID=UPI00367E4901
MTTTDSPAATASWTPSLTNSPRAGISPSTAPPKVSRTTAPPRATEPEAIRTGEFPYAFENRTRTLSPPAVSRTTCRSD